MTAIAKVRTVTTYTIPGLRLPGHIIPANYTALVDFLRNQEPGTPILTLLANAQHPTRIALIAGDLKSALFNHHTGKLDPIAPDEWRGSSHWTSLQLDEVLIDGTTHSILLDQRPKADAVSALFEQIDATPNFPFRVRRLIELYYELRLDERDSAGDDQLEKILETLPWDGGSASEGPISRSYARWFRLLSVRRGTRRRVE